MFTGIVENCCPVLSIEEGQGLRRLVLDLSPLRARDPSEGDARSGSPGAEGGPLVDLGDSVAVNGTCLTVATLEGDRAGFDAIPETLALTNLGELAPGHAVNIERALAFGARVDGHLVQGHVEAAGVVRAVMDQPGQRVVEVTCGPEFVRGILHKGSITVDGISLTVTERGPDFFAVALVPHTLERTTLGRVTVGDRVNLEPDLIGAWIRHAVAEAMNEADPQSTDGT